MARLPQPGNDQGVWGDILNDFLSQGHKGDGSLKDGSVISSVIADGAVTTAKLATGSAPSAGQALTYGGSGLSWTTLSASGSVPDADATTKGLIQLTGQLGGTAASPTVPGLASKENTITAGTTTQYYRGDKSWQTLNAAAVGLGNVNNTSDANKPVSSAVQTALDGKATDSAVVHLSGNETVTGTKNFTGTLQAGGQAVVVTNDSRLTDQRTPSNTSVTVAKLSAANSPTNGQILSYNGTTFNWIAAPTGGSDPVMGGDISGNASNAQIVAGAVGATELATNAVTTIKITDANVTTAKIADSNVTTAKIADTNVTTAKIADNAITEPKLNISNSPSNNQVLTWQGSALTWTTPSGGGSSSWNINNFTSTATNSPVYPAAGDWLIINNASFSTRVFLPASASAGAKILIKLKTVYPTVGFQANVFVGDTNSYADPSGGSSLILNTQMSAAEFMSDGTDWFVISRYDS
ncbi:MAG: hypothetical protein WBP26_04265 [Candidatus Saccharimonadales bacterium]